MTRRSWLFDGTVAAAVVLSGVLEGVWGIDASRPQGPAWAETGLYVITGALLAFRRARPLAVLGAVTLVSAAEFVTFGSPEGMGIALPGLIAGYSVARWENRSRPWWGLVLLAVLALAWSGFDPQYDPLWRRWLYGAPWAMLWLIAWLVGFMVRAQARAVEQRKLVRDQRAAQAVAEERNRIARELHDVIGHSVSVMTVQASAVRRRLRPDQDVEREALTTVESVGREALAEMRRMVGMLRQHGDAVEREPAPGLDQLDRLANKVRAAGLRVDMHIDGPPRPLAPGLDLTAYRLVQEGLTNALRHGLGASRADVHIDYRATDVVVRVRNDGHEVRSVSEEGHGLLGMRERVAVYGGSLDAMPRPGGGFELVATLPFDNASVEDA